MSVRPRDDRKIRVCPRRADLYIALMSDVSENITEQVIAETIDYIVAQCDSGADEGIGPLALECLARRAGYESTYFQKIFREKVGISPKRLIQYMHIRHVRSLLADGASVMDAALQAGLSGTGRLHDLCVNCEAVRPGDLRYKGRGVRVWYGFHPTPLGEIMIGVTERGICYLGFLVGQSRDVPLQRMKQYLSQAEFTADQERTTPAAAQIIALWQGQEGAAPRKKLMLDLHGTNLQIQVWQALLKIPPGYTQSYQEIAAFVGRPRAARAIGNAVGANPVSLLIPCHRVIRASGIIDNYGWGSPRKKLLLGLEQDRL